MSAEVPALDQLSQRPPLPPSPARVLHGAFLVNKPAGMTSFAVIEEIRRVWRTKFQCSRKDVPALGHGGTLDPFATGLLVVGIGNGVKLLRYFLGSEKRYSGTIFFGRSTQTGDYTGALRDECQAVPKSMESIQECASGFVGRDYHQIPPMVSAKLQGGVRLYELARKGIEVERSPKVCRLPRFEITRYEAPLAEFVVDCSSGTYIRTLAEDLAKELGTLAHLTALHRVKSGPFELCGSSHRAVSLEDLCRSMSGTWPLNIPGFVEFDQLLSSFPPIHCNPEAAVALTQGKKSILPSLVRIIPQPAGAKATSDAIDHLAFWPVFCKKKLIGVLSSDPLGNIQIDRTFPSALEVLN